MKQGPRSQESYNSWPGGSADFISVGTTGVDGEVDFVQRNVSTASLANVELRPRAIHSSPAHCQPAKLNVDTIHPVADTPCRSDISVILPPRTCRVCSFGRI
jgi:hypothetical protein